MYLKDTLEQFSMQLKNAGLFSFKNYQLMCVT